MGLLTNSRKDTDYINIFLWNFLSVLFPTRLEFGIWNIFVVTVYNVNLVGKANLRLLSSKVSFLACMMNPSETKYSMLLNNAFVHSYCLYVISVCSKSVSIVWLLIFFFLFQTPSLSPSVWIFRLLMWIFHCNLSQSGFSLMHTAKRPPGHLYMMAFHRMPDIFSMQL